MPSSSSTLPSHLPQPSPHIDQKGCWTATMELQEPSTDTDKLSYEIFSILESKFLFGYDDQKLWLPKQITPSTSAATTIDVLPSAAASVPAGADVGSRSRGKVYILSIDDGGMRGIVAGKALTYLEQALKTKSGNPNTRIIGYFDVAAGTGVGGIFTAMLFATKGGDQPIFRAEDTWKFLADKGNRFYCPPTVSDSVSLMRKFFRREGGGGSSGSAGMERAMKDAFTEGDRNLTLKDTLMPALIMCYDLLLLPPPPPPARFTIDDLADLGLMEHLRLCLWRCRPGEREDDEERA